MTLRHLAAPLCLVLFLGAGGPGCGSDSKSGAKGPQAAARGGAGRGRAVAFPVEVVPVSSRQVEYAVTAVGSVEAFEIVQVTARVPGAVEKINFLEGSRVTNGDVLVEIEPERYRLNVEEAKASVEKAKAALAEAEAGLARRSGANEKKTGLIPGEEIDAWQTRVRTATAEVSSQEASLQQTERNLRDALVKAPFSGIIQSRNVQTGEYVQPGTLLTTLVRRDPLLLKFQVPEADATRLNPGMSARFKVSGNDGTYGANIIHVAESADPTSRMVAVTAEIRNPDEGLRPGSFAEITVPVGSPVNSPVIPQTAVRPSERGFLAYVIEGGKAHERVLSLGLRTEDGLVEVKGGLAAAESLVVRGGEALRDGATVRVMPPGSPELGARSGDGGGRRENEAGASETVRVPAGERKGS